MGVGGHKHHFNDTQIEREMKGIGDTVCANRSFSIEINSVVFLGSISKIERTMC